MRRRNKDTVRVQRLMASGNSVWLSAASAVRYFLHQVVTKHSKWQLYDVPQPSECNDCFDSTQAAAPPCARHRNRCHDQSCNLSACVRCSLPLFLMVGGSSRPPPLTPFVATSCREARHTEHTEPNARDKG